MKRIDWKRVWSVFHEWCDKKEVPCGKCGKLDGYPDWPDQMLQIQRLVEAQLKPRRRRK